MIEIEGDRVRVIDVGQYEKGEPSVPADQIIEGDAGAVRVNVAP